jgi:hypothetical protein
MLAADPDRSVTDMLLETGRGLSRRSGVRCYLIVEALAAARRDQDVAAAMREYVSEDADWLAGLMGVAQAAGEIDPRLSPDALAHFCILLAIGSALVSPGLHAVDDRDWAALLARVVAGLAPAPLNPQ